MGAVPHRPRLLRRGLRRRPPISQLNRSAAAVAPSSSSASPAAGPALEWPGKETRREAEERNEERLKVLLPRLPDVGRALLKCDGADHPCSLPICAVCALAYREGPIAQLHALAHAYAGPMKSRPSTSAYSGPALWRTRTSGAPVNSSADASTAPASKARLWWAESRLPGRRNGNAGCCMPRCSASESTRTPGSGSKRPWKTAALRSPSITSRCATPPSSSLTASSSSPTISPDVVASPCRRIVSSSSRRGGRDNASRTSCSPMAPVVAAVASSSTSSRAGVLCPARLSRGDGGGRERKAPGPDPGAYDFPVVAWGRSVKDTTLGRFVADIRRPLGPAAPREISLGSKRLAPTGSRSRGLCCETPLLVWTTTNTPRPNLVQQKLRAAAANSVTRLQLAVRKRSVK